MLVQGFIDMVGNMMIGSYDNKIYQHVLGGGYAYSVRGLTAGNLIYDKSTFQNVYSGSSEGGTEGIKGNYKQIVLGSSDAPVKSTDCIIKDCVSVPVGTIATSQNKVVVTGTYTNNTTELKTFKEIGLIGASIKLIRDGLPYAILYSRSVFPEPVVIPAGESKSFTITIDFNKFADTVVTA